MEVSVIEFIRMGRKIIISRTLKILEDKNQEIFKDNAPQNDKKISICKIAIK